MPWNLADQLAATSRTRFFAPPLASGVPNGNAQVGDLSNQQVAPGRYTVADLPDVTAGQTTVSKTFSIIVNPGAGFAPEPGFPTLPDPAIRLHAMATALVRFRPADNALVLETFIFESISGGHAPWWQRWIDAGRIPKTIVYLNIDVADLQARLNAGAGAAVMPGLSIPSAVDDVGHDVPIGVTERQQFTAGFFAGTDPDFALIAKAGAVLGQAGLSGAGPNRELRLQVQYADDTQAQPQPMNPRELLYLIYGNDSATSQQHPLLQAMEASVPPQPRNTRQMILRPPLRTWKRVMWEAGLEHTHRAAAWATANPLVADGFFNTFRRERVAGSGVFDPVGYTLNQLADKNKCNIFVSDVAIRSGFKACIQPLNAAAWHYIDANSYTNLGRSHQVAAGQPQAPAPVPITGTAPTDDKDLPWGMTYGQLVAAGMQSIQINNLMQVEGRCMIVAIMRGRRFDVDNQLHVVGACAAALKPINSGHIVFVRELAAPTAQDPQNPRLIAPVDPGFGAGFVNPRVIDKVWMTAAGAFTNGADDNHPWDPQLGGAAGAAASPLAAVRIQLIELLPGGDPDTLQGLALLNVRQTNRVNLGTSDEKARTRRRTTGPCCFDTFPQPNPISEANCPPNFPQ